MTIVRVSSIRWNGLSTDTKPSSPTPITGSTFKETNTGLEYHYDGSAWILRHYQTNPIFGPKSGAFYPRGNILAGSGMLTGMISTIAVGTGVETSIVNDVNGIGSILDTVATINSLAGFKITTNTYRKYNPTLMFRFLINATANFRFYAGFSSGSSANPASNSDYLNALSGVGIWIDSAVSSNWKVMHNAGSGASTIDDTSTAFDALVHTLTITANDGVPNFVVQLDGSTVTNGTVTATLPATGTLMGGLVYIENTTGSSRTVNLYKIWEQADL